MKLTNSFIKLLLFVLLLSSCRNENEFNEDKVTENLIIFSKAYGYVKYFHPSDEASQINWNKFSILGASEIGKCKAKKDVIKTLNSLFKPIAPSIKFATDSLDFEVERIKYTPNHIENYRLTYWQHQGLGIDMDRKDQTYVSQRINREVEGRESQLFGFKPKFGESIIEKIGDGIYCQIPIVLYCDKESTFPKGDINRLSKLKELLFNLDTTEIDNVFLRMGNIINVYNVFQHFYPYFDVVNVDWEAEFRRAILKSYTDRTLFDHQVTLEQFTAPLNDGHISIVNNSIKNYFIAPISWEWIENSLVITRVYKNELDLEVGDIVTHINNRKSSEHFEEIGSRISTGTIGWLNYRANILSLQGEEGSKMTVKIGNRNIELQRSVNLREDWKKIRKKKEEYLEIEAGIWYVNLNAMDIYTFNELLPKFKKSKSIIFDLRGYTKIHRAILNHLLPVDDTTQKWLQTPMIFYPDQNKKNGYLNHSWIGKVKAYEPYLGDKKLVFITNGEAISYSESIMGYVEGYNVGTILGQPTAGANGAANVFNLPGGFRVSWTGMKVLKHDGSQHHGIGILPDIYVNKTIQGIKNGRDEYLEKALEVIK